MTPTIPTSRLVLRQLLKSSPTQVRWLRDPTVVRYSEQRHHNHTFSSQHTFVSSFVGRSHIWGIFIVSTNEHIGNLTARHDDANNVSDVGILLGVPEHWHKGFGSEAWRAACSWLLDKDGGGVRKLEAGCARNNEAMLKIIQHSDFKQEGERLNHFLFNGNPVGAVLFGRMR
jgi:RimJ/RimL family protein N-acetyltransferase